MWGEGLLLDIPVIFVQNIQYKVKESFESGLNVS